MKVLRMHAICVHLRTRYLTNLSHVVLVSIGLQQASQHIKISQLTALRTLAVQHNARLVHLIHTSAVVVDMSVKHSNQ